jgi:glucan 1,3-beta-glucosidase
MRAHWDAWITEEHIAGLAQREVEIIRLPIGDWTLKPYGPYGGCMDGAADKIQWFLDTCHKYGIKILMDVHAMKGSQNGFDNSGRAWNVEWSDENNFEHWGVQAAEWLGTWENNEYTSINYDNIQWGIDVAAGLLDKWGNHPAFYAYEPVNEPWGSSPLDVLKDFYRSVRALVVEKAPHAKFVFHDAFHFDHNIWNDMFADDDHENVVMDTHFYTAWDGEKPYLGKFCDHYGESL